MHLNKIPFYMVNPYLYHRKEYWVKALSASPTCYDPSQSSWSIVNSKQPYKLPSRSSSKKDINGREENTLLLVEAEGGVYYDYKKKFSRRSQKPE